MLKNQALMIEKGLPIGALFVRETLLWQSERLRPTPFLQSCPRKGTSWRAWVGRVRQRAILNIPYLRWVSYGIWLGQCILREHLQGLNMMATETNSNGKGYQ